MQFHLNGFQPGNPTDYQAERAQDAAPPPVILGADVDVLVVGSGPTGLTLAAQLAAFPDVRTQIVEQKAGPLQIGQADGIACRTMEMFQAFGFCERVLREAYWVNETTFWKPDDTRPCDIVRSGVVQDVEQGLSEFPHVILNQARVHDFYLDLLRQSPAKVTTAYSRRLVSMNVDEAARCDASAYPITACFERVGSSPRALETVRARYVVGCDGARSAVRQCMGLSLVGDSASQAWGVMDVLVVTDFPDIRRKAAIHSSEEGSMLIIPREGGYLVRLYIELDKLAANQRVTSLEITTNDLIAAAARILKPYVLDVKEIAWWSVYEIGQRLCERFDDLPTTSTGRRIPRVFIAGDACHTHSPKAGQGMNVSMQDAFNLGWKLAAVIREHVAPELLCSYSAERRAIAKELIDFDHKFSRMFSARPKGSAAAGDSGIDPAEFQDYFMRAQRFTAGTETRYQPSSITGSSTYQHLAKGFIVGTRLHSAEVIRVSDAKPMQLGHTVCADGRWRLFAFANSSSPSDRTSALWRLCEFLGESFESPVRRYTRAGADIDAVIEVIAICQQHHDCLSIADMPPMLRPPKGRFGLIDYEKLYCPAVRPNPDIFDVRGIDRQAGGIVVVRPDQHIAHVLPLDAHAELAEFFERFML